MSGFRGSIAPASSKPGNRPLATGHWLPAFPGLYCPGLIEALARARTRPRPSKFPGLYCPGLIEAALLDVEDAGVAEFPGLYCPGLIEAVAGGR